MKKFKTTLALFIIFFITFIGNAGNERPVHEIHSMMIYNFIKYIQWPDYDSSQDFIIGVIGEDDVYNTLSTWYDGKLRGDKKFSVKKYNSIAEIGNAHIIYVGKNEGRSFGAIQQKIKGTSVLTITDNPGLGEKGSAINFKTVNSKLAFELNQKTIDQSNLKVSGQLSAMAILI
jgi:hypothetical protein